MKKILFCLCLLSVVACRRPPDNEDLDIIGTTIEYSFEPSTKNVAYRVEYTSQIGSLVSEIVSPGQSFYKSIRTNQTMGFKNADIIIYNASSQKSLTGDVKLKRAGQDKTSQTITITSQASWKFTDYVYR